MFDKTTVVIRGAGDLATGVAARLWRAGFPLVMTEIAQPLTVRRTVALSEAVYEAETRVEDLTARRVANPAEIAAAWSAKLIPVLVDPAAEIIQEIKPQVVIDAILAKRNIGTSRAAAPLVIGLGPGFRAGDDVHAVIETNRGHYLGRVIWQGSAQPNTGVPGDIKGFSAERVIRAPTTGCFRGVRRIGDLVEKGEIVAYVAETPVCAPLNGVLRGLLHDGVTVHERMKSGDVDPRGVVEHCWTISDKALAIGGGALEAILVKMRHGCEEQRTL